MTGLEAVALTHSRGLMLSWDRPSTRDWAKVLETFPLFSGMSKRRLRKLVRKATFAEFVAGDTINSRGTNSDSLYLILGGAATARDPGAQVLSVGDYFGDAALNGRTPRSTTVVARQELHVMRLQRQSLLRLGFARLAPQGRARFALTRRP
jgi:signal-transduction protein with cAMP-binding, CBS, and nucleotidyltransferase domain